MQGWQVGPYSLSGHWPQAVPFGKVPDGHDDTHVCVGGSSSSGDVHDRQYVPLYWHVAQLLLQGVHTLLAPI